MAASNCIICQFQTIVHDSMQVFYMSVLKLKYTAVQIVIVVNFYMRLININRKRYIAPFLKIVIWAIWRQNKCHY